MIKIKQNTSKQNLVHFYGNYSIYLALYIAGFLFTNMD